MSDDPDAATPTFQNPIIRGFNPDPTICVVPASSSSPSFPTTYFLSTSTFEYFPSCAIYASTDLVSWRLVGHALSRARSQIELRTVEPGAGSWASTLRYRREEKRWYLATGVFTRYRPGSDERIFPRGFYVYTDNIWDDKAWSDPVYFDNPGFDQDLFWDDTKDGKVYLSTTVRLAKRSADSKLKDFAIHLSEIDLTTGRTLTPPVVIRESVHGIAEGSHIIHRGEYYYLFTAEGGTEAGHQEWVFRSTEGVFGPWEAQGRPLWYNGPDEEVQRTGHADIFEDDKGKWWAVFLGVRPVKRSDGKYIEPQMGRETFLVKVDWVDDWPVFNNGRNITLQTQARSGLNQLIAESKETGDIKWQATLDQRATDLELGWYQKNTPLKPCYTLTERPGYLRLYGNCYDLSSPEAPAMLLRKQTSYNENFETKVHFSPRKPGYEAGVVLWWSQYSYASIGITMYEQPNGGEPVRTIVVREPTGQAGSLKTSYPLLSSGQTLLLVPFSEDETFILKIEARPTSYCLRVSPLSGAVKEESFEVSTEALTVMPPIGGAFCGTMYGIYSFGAWEPVLDPADFSEIMIREG